MDEGRYHEISVICPCLSWLQCHVEALIGDWRQTFLWVWLGRMGDQALLRTTDN